MRWPRNGPTRTARNTSRATGSAENASGRGADRSDKLKAEIAELEGYLALARSIPANAKGGELVQVLPTVLDRIEKELGGKRKAVIFTESVRTQRYLSDLLAGAATTGEIALINGRTTMPRARPSMRIGSRGRRKAVRRDFRLEDRRHEGRHRRGVPRP